MLLSRVFKESYNLYLYILDDYITKISNLLKIWLYINLCYPLK